MAGSDTPWKARSVAVVGAGTMGAAIAQSASVAGLRAVVWDVVPPVLDRAFERVGSSTEKAVQGGRITAADGAAAMSRMVRASSLADIADCDLVIEAVVEDEAVKQQVLADISAAVPDAVIATNTSSYRVGDLAPSVVQPGRFVGLHYFFPAHINPLVEVVRGPDSQADAVDLAESFARATGKMPIRCRDGYGFAINRYFVPCLNEAARLAGEGAEPGLVDAVARETFGTPAGPFKVMNMTGPAIAYHAMRTLSRIGPFYEPSATLKTIASQGAQWQIDETATAKSPEADDIRKRLMAAVFLPVCELLHEDVASRADLDIGARRGLHWQWQPCAALDSMGAKAAELVADIARRTGHPAPSVPGDA